MKKILLELSAAILFFGPLSVSQAQTGTTYILASPGMSIPNGPGTIADVGSFSISNGGAAYMATLQNTAPGTGTFGIYSVTLAGTQEIFRTNETAPGGGTITGVLDTPRINANGDVVAYATIDNEAALLAGDGTSLRTVVRYNEALPDGNGQFDGFSGQTINNSGNVAFWGSIQNGGGPLNTTNGIFIGNSDGTITEIARTGGSVPGEANTIYGLSNITAINSQNQVIVEAELNGPNFGTGNDYGVYRGSSTGLVKIARSYDPAPDSTLLIGSPQAYDMNNSGTIVFNSTLINSAGTNMGSGIYTGSGGALTLIAQSGEASPDGNGTFTSFSNGNYINAEGEVAFTAAFSTPSSSSGILIGNGTNLSVLDRVGDKAPSGATYTGFDLARANNTGTVAFTAHLNGSSFDNGIFLTDGTQSITVAQAGSTINGKTIEQVGFDPKAFNDFQQIAYQAIFTDGTADIILFAPALSWRSTGSGSWDAAANWTVSLMPGTYNDIGIDPTSGGIVTGPGEDTTVQSLTLGGNATGTSELSLQSTGKLTATNGLTIEKNGMLGGNGTLIGTVTVQSGGTTYPGDPSTTTMTSVHYTNGSKAEFSIASTRTSDGLHSVTPGNGGTAGDYDQIILTANAPATLAIDSGATLQLDLSAASIETLKTNAGTDKYFLFLLGSGTSSGKFQDLTVTDGDGHSYTDSFVSGAATIDELGLQFNLSYTGDYETDSLSGGNDLVLTTTDLAAAAPEPETNVLLSIGAILLIGTHLYRKSRRNAQAC